MNFARSGRSRLATAAAAVAAMAAAAAAAAAAMAGDAATTAAELAVLDSTCGSLTAEKHLDVFVGLVVSDVFKRFS